MKAIGLSFLQMMRLIRRDRMLVAACLSPLLAGLAFKLGIPFAEGLLVQGTGRAGILSPYYSLIDLCFSMLAPVLFCFTAAMVVLEEHDDHVESYLFVTTLGRLGYFLSRICAPALLAFLFTAALLPFVKLTALSTGAIVLLSITGTLQGVLTALILVTVSTNKLEGVAVNKVASLSILGAFVPYFIPHPQQYLLSFLPSFWTGKAIYEQQLLFMLISAVLAALWIFIFLKWFQRKRS